MTMVQSEKKLSQITQKRSKSRLCDSLRTTQSLKEGKLQSKDVKKKRVTKRRETLLEVKKKLKSDSPGKSTDRVRPCETSAAREKRLAADRARKALRRASETPKERAKRLETARKAKERQRTNNILNKVKNKKRSLTYESPAAREKRLAADRARKAQQRALETPEERIVRLETDRKLKALQRETAKQGSVSETPGQREVRLAEYRKRKEQLLAEMRELRLVAVRERKEQSCPLEPQALLEVRFEEGQELRLSPCEEELTESIEIPLLDSFSEMQERSEKFEPDRDRKLPSCEAVCQGVETSPKNSRKRKGVPLVYETPADREKRLAADRARKAQRRALETQRERARRLEIERRAKALQRAKNKLKKELQHEMRKGAIYKENACSRLPKSNNITLQCHSGSNSKQGLQALQSGQFAAPGTSGVTPDTSNTMPSTSGSMETEMAPGMGIKQEIDIEEEKLIRVKTEVPVLLDQKGLEGYLDVQTTCLSIKLEPETDPKENYLVERDDISDKPTIIREAEPSSTRTNANIKQESGESIITYDYPTFDDAGSMDSNEAEALGNVETCLQDDINIKSENGVHLEDHQKEEFLTNMKMESDITSETRSSNLILPDDILEPPKYSFVMKIPGDVVCQIDEMITNGNDVDADFETYLGNETNEDRDMRLNKESLNYTTIETMLENADKAKTIDSHSFQLNSITGNFLSLEQEAYNMLKPKKVRCPKCPNEYNSKTLSRHLRRVHKITKNKQTTKKRRKAKKVLAKSEKEDDSQGSCSVSQENKTENKEGYRCTCGKTFQRKTRMQSCLRTHDCCESEKYYCMTCLKDFKSKDELALHRKRLHRKKFPCKFCPTDYATRKKLFKHLQIHQKVNQMEYKVIEEVVKKKKKLRCFLCSNFYTEISELKIHVMTEHEGPYSCPHCRNTFPKIIDFGNHTKTYHPEVGGESVLDVLEAFSRLTREWKCEECGLQFLEADKLALHQVEQHSPELKSEQQFQCSDCRRVFVSQKGLTSHRRIHHSVETSEQTKVEVTGIMCLECRKMCKDMTTLTSHMRFHSPDRKYPCKFCDFRFATPEKRKTHAEIHIGEMKYVCFICEYQCSSENRLKTHKKSLKHESMQEYLLTGKPLIEEASTSKDTVKKVNKKSNNSKEDNKSDSSNSDTEEVSCDVCGEMFPGESAMLEHKETHPFIEIPSGDNPTRIFFK